MAAPEPSSSTSSDAPRLLKIATAASVGTACLLIAVKLAAWLYTDAVSVLASLVDSLIDAVASLITLLAVRYSLTPADQEHRFGHGKAEPLAALLQACLILGSCGFIVHQAVERLRAPRELDALVPAIGVMLFAIAATLVLTMVQRHVIRRTHSPAILADRIHYQADLLSNSATLLALCLTQRGVLLADPLLALGIAAWLLIATRQVLREAIDQLLDRELPATEREAILAVARQSTGVRGVHGLRTRRSGRTRVIQLHLELGGDLPLAEAEAIARAVKAGILERFPGADTLVLLATDTGAGQTPT